MKDFWKWAVKTNAWATWGFTLWFTLVAVVAGIGVVVEAAPFLIVYCLFTNGVLLALVLNTTLRCYRMDKMKEST